MTGPVLRRALSVVCAASAMSMGLGGSGAAAAQQGAFVTRTLAEPAAPGLTVTGPLSDLRATARARVVVPMGWRARPAPAGQLRFATTQNGSCRYGVAYTVHSLLAPASSDAPSRVAAELPAASVRHLIDVGVHNGSAFRVVRRPGIGGRVRLDALWSGVLTRRADIAPAGQAAWTEIRVTALSRAGDECHAGTWRQALGPAIGDSLATARASLRFGKPGGR
jgi:hypothetical protein